MSSLAHYRLPSATQIRSDLVDLTVEQHTLIGYRKDMVDQWRAMCIAFDRVGASKESATREFLAKHSEISRRTLYRWDKALRDDLRLTPSERLGLRVLLDGRSAPQASSLKPHAAQDDSPAWRFFKSVYNAIPPQTVVTCWHITKAQSDTQGWYWPSLRTVQMRVAEPAFQYYSTFFRLGEREWMRKFGPSDERQYDLLRSGEHLMGDFHELDTFCRRSDDDSTIVRPLVSAFLDIRSRRVVIHVCERETQREVLAGLVAWIREFGKPWHVTIDNGKPYRSLGFSGGRQTEKRILDENYLHSMLGGMGIAAHFSIAHNPNGKANLERFFGTLEMQNRFPTWCGSKKDDTFKLQSKKAKDHPELCPTVDEVRQSLLRWVREVYHQAEHGGTEMNGLSPDQAWQEFDPVPLEIAEPAVLEHLLMLTAEATVSKMGVTYKGVYFNNYAALGPRIGTRVTLRIPEPMAGTVIVCDIDTGVPICEAHNAAFRHLDVTWDHVAEGAKAKARTKRAMKALRDVTTTSAIGNAAENAISARAAEIKRTASSRTGTDDQPVRNIKSLRPDLVGKLIRSTSRPMEPFEEPLSLCDVDLGTQHSALSVDSEPDPDLSLGDLL